MSQVHRGERPAASGQQPAAGKGQKKCKQVKLNHATVSKMCSVQSSGSLVCCALQGGLGCGCDSVGNREYSWADIGLQKNDWADIGPVTNKAHS